MTDREERQHVIEVLKQMRLDYEDFWEENDTEEIKAFNYAIASIETDLKYDLLYEQESNCLKIPTGSTTKDYLGVDCISRRAVIEEMEKRHAKGDYITKGFISSLPSVTPQLSSGLEKNSKKLEKDFGESDCISRSDVLKLMQDNWHTHNGDWAMQESMDDIRALPAVTPQEPRKGHWIEHPRTKELRFHHIYECSACKTQIIGNRYNVGNYKYCPHCGIEFEVEE